MTSTDLSSVSNHTSENMESLYTVPSGGEAPLYTLSLYHPYQIFFNPVCSPMYVFKTILECSNKIQTKQ
jgi:hypothetical protein